MRPKIMLFDEPTSALDVSVQAQILNLLKELQREFNLTYLFISHDLGVVRYMSNRIGVMYLGSMVETGLTHNVFRQSQHPYTRVLLSSLPSLDPDKPHTGILLEGDPPTPIDPPPGCPFSTRCAFAQEVCRSEVPAFRDMGSGHRVRCHFAEEIEAAKWTPSEDIKPPSLEVKEGAAESILSVEDLKKYYEVKGSSLKDVLGFGEKRYVKAVENATTLRDRCS